MSTLFRIPSLEALDEPAAQPAPQGTGQPTPEDPNVQDPAPQTPQAQDPAPATPDAPAAGDTGTGSGADGEQPEVDDQPIPPADQLQITQFLKDAQAQDDEALLDQRHDSREIVQAIDETQAIAGAAEAAKGTGQEDFASAISAAGKMASELFEKILRFIRSIITTTARLLRASRDRGAHIKRTLEDTTKRFCEFRQRNAAQLAKVTSGTFDPARYINNPALFKELSWGGVQPGAAGSKEVRSYAEAFERQGVQLEIIRRLMTGRLRPVIAGLPGIVDEVAQTGHFNTRLLAVPPAELILPFSRKIDYKRLSEEVQGLRIYPIGGGSVPLANLDFYYARMALGDKYVVTCLAKPTQVDPSTNEGALDLMSSFSIGLYAENNLRSPVDGYLRRLEEEEVTDGTRQMLRLLQDADNSITEYDKLTELISQLEDAVVRMMHSQYRNEPVSMKLGALITRWVQLVTENRSDMVRSYYQLASVWTAYIQLVMARDQELLLKAA